MNITSAYLNVLKPCPKCGSNSLKFWFSTVMNYSRSYFIECCSCGCSTGEVSGASQCLNRWNVKMREKGANNILTRRE